MAEQVHALDDVFGVARELPLNYVVRESVDARLVDALTRDQHIVIYGSSKQGKTCLRKYSLKPEDYVVVTCSNKWSLAQLHSAILKAAGYVVTGTTTKAVSGETKVSAKLKAGFRLFGQGVEGEAGTEGARGTQEQVESTPLEIDPADVNDIVDALNVAGCTQFIVLEDFHYLPEETQKDFSVALKAFHEDSKYSFVVVGVWKDENRLAQQNGDLVGRVVAIDADRWTPDELLEVIQSGEQLLNISFQESFKSALLDGCFDSIFVVQESCRRACENAGVLHTQEGDQREISANADDLIQTAVDAHSARYNDFIFNFANGFQKTELEMYRWLLWPVLNADVTDLERGLRYGDLRLTINDHHPRTPINPGNITQALSSTASLQVKLDVKPIILDYNQTSRLLNVVDRSFLIWIQHQDRKDLLALAELPYV